MDTEQNIPSKRHSLYIVYSYLFIIIYINAKLLQRKQQLIHTIFT